MKTEILQVTTEMLIKNNLKTALIRNKVGNKPVKALAISTFSIFAIILILTELIFVSEVLKILIIIFAFIILLTTYIKFFDDWINKNYYENSKYQPTNKEMTEALRKEYKKISKEKLEKAISLKKDIKKTEEEIKLSISQADEYIALGIQVENIDVEKWCKENSWNKNPSTSAQAYDEEIGSLRTQLW